MLLSKSLQLSDYDEILEGVRLVQMTDAQFSGKFYFPHPHRLWEYGSAVQAHIDKWLSPMIGYVNPLTVLDVGGGYGALGPTFAIQLETKVTEIEIDQTIIDKRNSLNIPNLTAELGSALDLSGEKQYNSVFCISVIEHISGWQRALIRLTRSVAPGGLLVLTTDFGETSDPWINDSERDNKFVQKDIFEMLEILTEARFKFEADTKYHGAQVFDYTFFRIIAERR